MYKDKFPSQRVLVAVTGASGSIYAERLVQNLISNVERVYLVFSETGKKVADFELEHETFLKKALRGKTSVEEKKVLRLFGNDDLFSPIASGSSAPTSMVVVPASMGSVGRIASGVSGNLIERSADVMLKHKRQLIVCPRETPFNLIHLRNLTTLAEAGAEILPLMPAFYQKPKSIEDLVDFCVGRILEQLGVEHELYEAWNKRLR